jgi:hypothetical protein
MTKLELDPHILMMYPYNKFEMNMCYCCRDNEQELNDDGMTEQGNTICPRPFYGRGINTVGIILIHRNKFKHL